MKNDQVGIKKSKGFLYVLQKNMNLQREKLAEAKGGGEFKKNFKNPFARKYSPAKTLVCIAENIPN